jgi:hypothetical protein
MMWAGAVNRAPTRRVDNFSAARAEKPLPYWAYRRRRHAK